jgi:hypothetical protein
MYTIIKKKKHPVIYTNSFMLAHKGKIAFSWLSYRNGAKIRKQNQIKKSGTYLVLYHISALMSVMQAMLSWLPNTPRKPAA